MTTPVRHEPHISLEESTRDEVIVRIAATPETEADGPRLADEVLRNSLGHPRGRHRRAPRCPSRPRDGDADRDRSRADRDDNRADRDGTGADRDGTRTDGAGTSEPPL